MRRWLAAFAAVLALLGLAILGRELYRPYRGYSGSLMVVIHPGTRAPEATSLLVARGVLAHRWPFLFRYALGRLRHQHLKAGKYSFDQPLRPVDVYRKLVQGEVYLQAVMIPEGSDRFDIARILQQQLGVNPEEFLRVTELSSAIRDLDPQTPTLEGYLFPDTYRFAKGVSSATVVFAMLARFRRVVGSDFRQELSTSPTPLHDVITLASLVEKETPEPAERPVIAGVFSRRLEMGWPLQCDPTVVYAARLDARLTGRPIGFPRDPITQSELDFDSPYNTYRYRGLPPGAIASPGEASIRAALAPAAGDALYFVSNNRGGHIFARTLAEHQHNVARYRRELARLTGMVPGASGGSRRPGQNETVGPTDAKTRSTKSAKHTKQKTKNRGVLPGSGS